MALGADRQPRHVFADNNIRPVLRFGLAFNCFVIFFTISGHFIPVFDAACS